MSCNFLNFDESLEVWRDIKNYEGYYQVSNYGRIRSIDRIDNTNHPRKSIIMKLTKDKCGYLRVCLCKDGKAKHYLVHRLVAQAFILNPNSLPQINHKDENKLNNYVGNLEWCTAKENSNYGTRTERMKSKVQGKPKPYMVDYNKQTKSKIVGQFDMNMNLITTFPSTREAARQLSIHQSNIGRCAQGVSKSCHNYIFRYL